MYANRAVREEGSTIRVYENVVDGQRGQVERIPFNTALAFHIMGSR